MEIHSTALTGPLDFQNYLIFTHNFHATTLKTEIQIKNGFYTIASQYAKTQRSERPLK